MSTFGFSRLHKELCKRSPRHISQFLKKLSICTVLPLEGSERRNFVSEWLPLLLGPDKVTMDSLCIWDRWGDTVIVWTERICTYTSTNGLMCNDDSLNSEPFYRTGMAPVIARTCSAIRQQPEILKAQSSQLLLKPVQALARPPSIPQSAHKCRARDHLEACLQGQFCEFGGERPWAALFFLQDAKRTASAGLRGYHF